MKQIDLHVHSTCSDGTDSPAVLVNKAVDKGLAAFALTDHDTTRGVKEALLACENVNKTGHELEVIPGVEISTNYDNTEIHVVGLFIDYNDNEFNSFLNKQLSSRDERNKRVCERFQNIGINITYEDMLKTYGDAVITRAHFADSPKSVTGAKIAVRAPRITLAEPSRIRSQFSSRFEVVSLLCRMATFSAPKRF